MSRQRRYWLAVAQVWEAARVAMLMSRATSAETPLVADWIEYDRVLDSTATFVLSQRVRSTSAPTTHAFRAVPIERLDSAGYVTADASGVSYYAPDADVLLSDAFIGGHCFQLDDSRSAAGLLGVRFEPAAERATKREIVGTVWVDRTTAELRSLDFGYTNLAEVAEPIAGGSVEFMRLGEGNWMVRRWTLRMPRIDRVTTKEGNALVRSVLSVTGNRVRDVEVAGGEVSQVQRGDSVLYIGVGSRIDAQLTSPDGLPVAGAIVQVAGTDYAGVADEHGRVLITPALEGRYRASITTPTTAALGLAPVARDLVSRAGATIDTIALPPASSVLTAACPRDSAGADAAVLFGVVRSAVGSPVAGAAITVSWHAGGAAERVDDKVVGALSRFNGGWQVCGVPRGRDLAIEVATDVAGAKRVQRLASDQALATVDLTLDPASTKASRAAFTSLASADGRRAVVEFIVVGTHGQPLANTTLDVGDARGGRHTYTTGETGKALAPGLPAGELSVVTRHIGSAPGKVTANVTAGRNTIPIVLNESAAPTLDTVRVYGGRTVSTLRRATDFDLRRSAHLARLSLDADDIRKANPIDLWELLRASPSIRVVDDQNGVVATSSRTVSLGGDGSVNACYLAVMINGLVANPGNQPFNLNLLPKPDEVYGVELFVSAAEIPMQYTNGGHDGSCGMIAVWTK